MLISNGLYFNVTGIDGSGKDSVVEKVLESVNQDNLVVFREPGGTDLSEKIREIILTTNDETRGHLFSTFDFTKAESVTKNYVKLGHKCFIKGNVPLMELYLYAASRNETNINIVDKNILKGYSVLGLRSLSCSVAYQGKARGLGVEKVLEVNEKVIRRFPDFEIYIDVPVDVASDRLKGRTGKRDRLDLEDMSFHKLTREGYLEYYKMCGFPVYIIDGTGTIEENAEKVLKVLKKYKKRNAS